ncbi:MAG: endonuclease III [Puniceicoccales bacterium]|jgi:endonuclease-3|nr:endonuclease III [Puniceicoccales bacterium]
MHPSIHPKNAILIASTSQKIATDRGSVVLRWLQKLFPQPEISLHYDNAFTFLVAVILSAQCRDDRVNQVTPKLFVRADSPEKFSTVPIEELENFIRPCGLFRHKAKFLKRLAEELVSHHAGNVPASLEDLEKLPGVGHKTASVVASQFFGQDAFPVDTHIHRCARRWGLSHGKNVRQTEKDLCSLYPRELWRILHIQIILYARKYCPARGHKSEICPICSELSS